MSYYIYIRYSCSVIMEKKDQAMELKVMASRRHEVC